MLTIERTRDEASTAMLELHHDQVTKLHGHFDNSEIRENIGRELYCIGQLLAERSEDRTGLLPWDRRGY